MTVQYPIERKPRTSFFPFGGNRNSQRHVNAYGSRENRRHQHGTDPLKDGFDPQENPIIRNPRRYRSNIPI